MEVKEIKPFSQVPFCEPETLLTITAAEFQAIQNALNPYQGSLNAIQTIFDRNINNGNITIKYVQQDGTEITKEEAEQYIVQAANFLKNKEKVPS